MMFDTDIVIWYLRGNRAAADMISASSRREISIVTMLELVQGSRNKRELAGLRPELSRLDIGIIDMDDRIGHRALALMERHALKDGLGMADSLIAATALETGRPFATANGKHYRPLGLDLHIFTP